MSLLMDAEKEIIQAILIKIIATGHAFCVVDEEDETIIGKTSKIQQDKVSDFTDQMGEGEIEKIEVFDEHKQYIGTIMLVYGNDGYDVVCDYSTSLDFIMESDSVESVISKWENA